MTNSKAERLHTFPVEQHLQQDTFCNLKKKKSPQLNLLLIIANVLNHFVFIVKTKCINSESHLSFTPENY